MYLDTTSSNNDRQYPIKQLLNHELLQIAYLYYILEVISRVGYFQAMSTSSAPDILLFKCLKQIDIIFTRPNIKTPQLMIA